MRYLQFLLIITFLLGGCMTRDIRNEATEKEVQTLALQDDFTKEFIPSTEEAEEGYYTFESGVGGYTMLYPVNAVMDQTYYQYRGQEYEVILFGEGREKENYGYSVRGRFEDGKMAQLIDSNLDFLIGSKKLITTEDFEKYTRGDNEIYFAEYKNNINNNKNGYYLNFLGYIKSQTSDKAIGLTYSSTCLSETEECKLDLKQERERAKKIFHSVRFTSSSMEGR